MSNAPCPVCQRPDAHYSGVNPTEIACRRCGVYNIGIGLKTKLQAGISHVDRDLLCIALRLAFGRIRSKEDVITIEEDNVDDFMRDVSVATDPFAVATELLLYVRRHLRGFGASVQINPDTDYPLFRLRDVSEYAFAMRIAHDLKWLSTNTTGQLVFLEPKGWERVLELEQTGKTSRQAFVAMWFDEAMNSAYEHGIAAAIRDCGFKPVRVDRVEHNHRIDDEIIGQIRRSAFVVSDFTGFRSGVFFEAGFGLGLGLPVIWTCNAGKFKQLAKHFDTRQYSHIKWATAEDLRKQLRNRILATIDGARLVVEE